MKERKYQARILIKKSDAKQCMKDLENDGWINKGFQDMTNINDRDEYIMTFEKYYLE